MKILACIDFSEATDKIVTQLKLVARGNNASIILLHVSEPEPQMVGYKTGAGSVHDEVNKARREQHHQLESYVDALKQEGLDASCMMKNGAYTDTILEQGEQQQADMLVIGSHGKGLASHLLLGSVSQSIIKNAKVPVLVIPIHK